MPDLFLMQHGQSSYNLENRFTGSLDVPLSDVGIQEAKSASQRLEFHKINVAYTLKLERAINTLQIILEKKNETIPVIQTATLNERSYGKLQGLNKGDAAKLMAKNKYCCGGSYEATSPGGESLKDTANRVLPYYHSVICADLCRSLNVLVVSHGNSLRAIIKELDTINDEDIVRLNIDTGKIYLYQLDPDLKIISKCIL